MTAKQRNKITEHDPLLPVLTNALAASAVRLEGALRKTLYLAWGFGAMAVIAMSALLWRLWL